MAEVALSHPPPYRGRFAPSPTGALHLGSLLAAMGSYLDARAHGGEWLLRIEDVDRQREVPGAADRILFTLEAFGFEWDGAPVYQSHRTQRYAAAVEMLKEAALAYPCACTRREVERHGKRGTEGVVYPGTCRFRLLPGRSPRSVRLRVVPGCWSFRDRLQGRVRQDIDTAVGDFVIKRADGFYAYQLTVVVDDAAQGITHVVRGADLLASTPRQIYLQECLGLPTPTYLHLPVLVDSKGTKLSKQWSAAPVTPTNPLPALGLAAALLGQPRPPEPPHSVAQFWDWSIDHWRPELVPCRREISLPDRFV